MIGWMFIALSFIVTAWAFWSGTNEVRFAMGVLFLAFGATAFLYQQGVASWLVPQDAIFVVDTLAMALLASLALRSKRFWPLPVAALQAIPILTHVGRAVGSGLDSYAVGLAQTLPSYAQMAMILVAIQRERRRRKVMIGNC